jgi:hypothetical protein
VGLEMEDFMAIWYILWPFGIFYGHLVHFPHFVIFAKKNLATRNIPRLKTRLFA